MPMSSKEDHGAQDPNNPYCIHCTDLNGKLLSFEKKYEDFVRNAMENRWMSREKAEKTALEEMAQMPAWRQKIQQATKTG
jgi:Putative zinc ribbon domain